MRINVQQLQSRTTPSKKFTRKINESSSFTRHPNNLHTTTVYLLRPPRSFSSPDNRPWIIFPDTTTATAATTASTTVVLRHPLTSKPFLCNLPRNFNLWKLHPSAIADSYHFAAADKLLVVPTPSFNSRNNADVRNCSLFALYDGGELRGCPRAAADTSDAAEESPWVRLTTGGEKFDDIAAFGGKIYAVDRYGMLILINNYKTSRKISIAKTLISDYVASNSRRFGWRKRLVVDGGSLYLVVRDEEKLFSVHMLKWRGKWRAKKRGKTCFWEEVSVFDGNKVLFMARDYYFFRKASSLFPGREYRNCIVFSEAAFPRYGKDCWEFTESVRKLGVVRKCEDDVAVFRLSDRVFAREGENSGFPKINWLPPAWIFRASSVPADEFEGDSEMESSSSSHSERETSGSRDENDGEVKSDVKDSDSKDDEEQEEMESDLKDSDSKDEEEQEEMESDLKDSDSKDEEEQEEMESDLGSQDENDGEVQSDSKGSNSKDEEEQEEMESDLGSQDQAPEVVEIVESDSDSQGEVQEVVEIMESDSDIQVQEDGEMQCDSNSEEKEDKKMHSKANIEDDASLQEDIVTPLLSAVEEEVTKTLLSMNSRNDVVEEEISGKNSAHMIPKACTSSTTEIHTSCSATTNFEGLDVRSDLVPTLQKIWRKHGNITKDSIVRSNDIIARALESLATVVQILEDNLAESLSDSQADYLSTTLSDLKCIRFKVCWLVSFVEKALKIHKSKDLMESLNNLSQLSSQIKERKSVILDEVAKLNEEENKLKEEMAKVSKTIPLYGQVKFDEPIGVGLT